MNFLQNLHEWIFFVWAGFVIELKKCIRCSWSWLEEALTNQEVGDAEFDQDVEIAYCIKEAFLPEVVLYIFAWLKNILHILYQKLLLFNNVQNYAASFLEITGWLKTFHSTLCKYFLGRIGRRTFNPGTAIDVDIQVDNWSTRILKYHLWFEDFLFMVLRRASVFILLLNV